MVFGQRLWGPCYAHRGPWTQRGKTGFARVREDAPARAALGLEMSKLEPQWWPYRHRELLPVPSKELPHEKSVKRQCGHQKDVRAEFWGVGRPPFLNSSPAYMV